MKNKFLTTMAATALLVMLAVGSAYAQGADVIRVAVPFDFDISGKTFPAGEYVVTRSIEGPRLVLMIQSEDNNRAAYLAFHPVQARDVQQESKLVFNRYGDQYFLSQVWTSGRDSGEELTKTSKERLLQREIAKRGSKPETVATVGRAK